MCFVRYYIRPVLDAISSTTTRSTIGELNKYQIQQKRDGSWMPMYAMTKKQWNLEKDSYVDKYGGKDYHKFVNNEYMRMR